MTRACSSEYFAGVGLNELSECQSILRRLNRRRGIVRSQCLTIAVEVGNVADPYAKPAPLRLASVRALAQTFEIIAYRADRKRDYATRGRDRRDTVRGLFKRSEITAKRQLLSIVNSLVMKNENREAVHPRLDGCDGFRSGGLTQVDAFDLPEKVRMGRIDRTNAKRHFLSRLKCRRDDTPQHIRVTCTATIPQSSCGTKGYSGVIHSDACALWRRRRIRSSNRAFSSS